MKGDGVGHQQLSPKPADICGDFRHIIVELMVTTGESAYDSSWNSLRVEVSVLERRRFILTAMIHIHWCPSRQSLAKTGHGLDVLARPATLTHERRREKKDAAQRQVGRLLDKRSDQDRSAHRMAHQNRSIIQSAELLLEGSAPARVLGVGFVRHARVADFVVWPEFSPEAFDELVVPLIMRAFCATALNEQHLMRHGESLLNGRVAAPGGWAAPPP